MYRLAVFLLACHLLLIRGIAQEENESAPTSSLYESVVVPDRSHLRRLEQADRLFETGRSSESAVILGTTLEQAVSAFVVPEESQESPVRTIRQTTNDQIIDRLRKLPKEALNSYTFQFEATAKRLLDNALASETSAADSLEEIQQIAQKYFPTASGATATFFVGLTQFERGDFVASFLTLDRLKRLHPDVPKNIAVLLEPMHAELQNKLRDADEPVHSDIEKSAWLDQIGWRVPAGSPDQNTDTIASVPLFEQSWTLPLHARLHQERETETISRTLHADEDVYIPASQPLVAGDLFITRTLDEIIAVDIRSGKRIWTSREPRYRFPDKTVVPPLTAGDTPLRLFFWHDRISHQLSSEGSALFSIEDYDLHRMDIQSFGRLPKLRGKIEDPRYISGNTLTAHDLHTGQILWQVGKFPYVQKSIDALFSPSQQNASSSASQPNIDETIFTGDEKALKETWFLGAPLPLQGRLYIIGETDGVLQLFMLDSRSGRLVNRQPFAQIPSSLLANIVRRTYPLFPSASSGIVLCPTGNGLIVALDATTLSPLWCFTYAAAVTTQPVNRMLRNQQQVFPGMNVNDVYLRQLFGESGWQVPSIMIDRQKVLAAPPDRAALYCLDLLSGECLWEQTISRLNALYTACIQNNKVFLVTPINIMAFDLNTGKDVSFGGHRFQTSLKPAGKGVLSGNQYFIPFSEGYLAVADLSDGTLTWRNASGLVAAPPASAAPHVRQSNYLGLSGTQYRGFGYGDNGSLFSSADLMAENIFPQTLQFGNLLGIKGRVFSQSPTQIACFDQKNLIEQQSSTLLQTDPNDPEGLRQQGRILKSKGNLDEAIHAFRSSLKAQPRIETADALRKNLLEAMKKDYPTWSAAGEELESLAEFPDEKGIALYTQIDGMVRSGRTDELAPLVQKVANLNQEKMVLIPVEKDYSVQLQRAVESRILQSQKTVRAASTTPTSHALEWSKISSPLVWRSGNVSVEDITASYRVSVQPEANNNESARIIERLLNIAKNMGTPSAQGVRLTVPFLGTSDSEHATFDYTLKPGLDNFFLCCGDSLGQERWRLALPMNTFHNLGRMPNDNRVVYLKGFQNFLLFVQGNTITAMDVSVQLGKSPQILWTKTLSALQVGYQTSNRQLSSDKQSVPFNPSFPMNSVFVSPQIVCCGDEHCVYGLEPLTGQLIWVRRTNNKFYSLLGDSEHLFLIVPELQKVLALEPASGRELAFGLLPSGAMHTFGTNIVCSKWRGDSTDGVLSVCDLRDIFDKRRRALLFTDQPEGHWMPPIPEIILQDKAERTMIQMLYGGRFISLANGETKSLQIYDLLTKKHLLPQDNRLLEFVLAEQTDQMRCDVEFVEDKFLVLFTKDTRFDGNYTEPYEEQGRTFQRKFSPIQGVWNNGVGKGTMMLFDSAGNPLWQKPVEIKSWSRLLDIPERLPVMLFAASFADTEIIGDKAPKTAEASTGIMGIDKRTGERRFRSTITSEPLLRSFRVHADWQKQEILFITPEEIPNRVIKASFTDKTESKP